MDSTVVSTVMHPEFVSLMIFLRVRSNESHVMWSHFFLLDLRIYTTVYIRVQDKFQQGSDPFHLASVTQERLA